AQAAFTLGYSEKMTFYKIILPQAIRYIMPSYKAEIVSLIKATAVVGYIAVQDLTKVGDQVRSRTYEAFFPLIIVTILYFVLAAILSAFINRIDFVSDRRKRSPEQILKGVDRK
ncbi:MAG: ABC transporter permease subunit, partial [Erysipelotrichaceae bacterium]|nr:ABC transporter permease subunit [Erysipelotrichaceae bacterium]